ncbi:FAD-binding oxidoreductase [Rathayibacter sp. YIM 133350]|uniref:FAD-binding oxidoreductase n=1 Tax=Rathayibacter sp. YIM 133350 TaxID=3131992 RepID=UPI00307D6AA4
MSLTTESSALDALRAELSGDLVLPGDEQYETARLPWNLSVDQRPAAIAVPADVDDVERIVRAAAAAGLGVSTQPNGHGANGSLEGVILVRPKRFDEITIDVETASARVGAGVNWGPALSQLDGTGLIALSGSNPEVNVVGLSLGGGHSMFSRAYGLAADSVTAVELVDGTGAVRRVTEDSDAELLWALRGGGGLFGVVTAIEFRLHPGDALFGGSLFYPLEAAVDVFLAVSDLAAEHPELGIDVGVARFPDLPVLPEPLRGRSVTSVAIVALGDAASAEPVAQALRGIATPIIDGLTSFTIGGLAAVANEPVDPMPTVDWGGTIDGFDRESAKAFVDAFLAGAEKGLSRAGVRILGGAIGRQSDALLGAISAPALIGAGVLIFDPAQVPAAQAALQPLRDVADRYPAQGMVPTFLGAGAGLADAFPPATIAKLAAIKQRVDPQGVIRSNRPLP